jgi:hypothetical protein
MHQYFLCCFMPVGYRAASHQLIHKDPLRLWYQLLHPTQICAGEQGALPFSDSYQHYSNFSIIHSSNCFTVFHSLWYLLIMAVSGPCCIFYLCFFFLSSEWMVNTGAGCYVDDIPLHCHGGDTNMQSITFVCSFWSGMKASGMSNVLWHQTTKTYISGCHWKVFEVWNYHQYFPYKEKKQPEEAPGIQMFPKFTPVFGRPSESDSALRVLPLWGDHLVCFNLHSLWLQEGREICNWRIKTHTCLENGTQ